MKLIDTSAWIEFMRRRGNPAVKDVVAHCLRMRWAAFTGPVRTELAAGARSERERKFLVDLFALCQPVVFAGEWWGMAGDIKRMLLQKGVAIPIMDVLIAVAAQESHMPVLTTDRDFEIIRRRVMPELQVELIP